MTDPNLQDFYMRVARIEAARLHGFGFEAAGTMGRSAYRRPRRRQVRVLRPLLVVLFSVILLKAVIHQSVGAETYDARVAELRAGAGLDRLGGWVMTPDPVMLWISAQMTARLPRMP